MTDQWTQDNCITPIIVFNFILRIAINRWASYNTEVEKLLWPEYVNVINELFEMAPPKEIELEQFRKIELCLEEKEQESPIVQYKLINQKKKMVVVKEHYTSYAQS